MSSMSSMSSMSREPTHPEVIERKILHILEHFPTISPSMIQISIGSGVPASIWQPVLERLIEAGEIHRWHRSVTSPSGRSQEITFISINPEPVKQ